MIRSTPGLEAPFLIVGWNPDVGEVAGCVNAYLRKYFPLRALAQVGPLGYFPLGGVEIKGDVIHFPQARFFSWEKGNLLFLHGDQPTSKRYKFLGAILDQAEKMKAEGMYTIGGIVSMIAHTDERKIFAIVNSEEVKKSLKDYGLDIGLDYQGVTSLNGFLLWVAAQRNIPAASLWVNVPFYLAEKVDPKASKAMLNFLKQRFDFDVNLKELDGEIEIQEGMISKIRKDNQEVDEYIARLELNVGLTQQEVGKLVEEINKAMA